MKNMYNFFDLKTIIIICLVIVILLMKMCTPKPPIEVGGDINVGGEKHVVIKRVIDTQYIPKTKVIYKPGEKISEEKIIYVDLPQKIDTFSILKDFYAKRIYKDTIKLEDSLGHITLIDTIQENKIKGRWFMSQINQVVIKDSIFIKKLPVNQLYFGGVLGADKVVGFNYFGPTFVLKTKSDNMYSLGLGINNNKNTSIQMGVYWKIKLK